MDRIPFARACETYAESPESPGSPESLGRAAGEAPNCGSGLLIADRLVLTAGHVAGRVGARAEVRFPQADDHAIRRRTFECTVLWSRLDERVDAALLRITDPGWEPPALPPLRWGRLVCDMPGVPCQAAGFPRANVVGPDGPRDWAHLSGTINTGGRRKRARLDIAVDAPPVRPPGGSLWAGVSGAALFVHGLLVGVIVEDPPAYASRRLMAVPVAGFADDPDFVTHLAVPPALLPAELESLRYQNRMERPAVGLLLAQPVASSGARDCRVPRAGRGDGVTAALA